MGNPSVTYQRQLPIRYETDVLVAGGGPAGTAAALAAVRQGCSVRLVEGHTCLGGMGTAGLVPGFCQFTDGVNFLAGGIGREIVDALRANDGLYPNTGYSIRAEILKRISEELLTAAGVPFTFHTQVVDVLREGGRVRQVICAGKSGLYAIAAKAFVDATGDGDLAVYAGARYEQGDDQGHTMPGTLCSLWANVDWNAVRSGGLGQGNSRIEEAFRDGVFSLEDRHLPGMYQVSGDIGGGNIGHTFGVDGTDEESLTEAYIWGRRSLLEYERYYKDYLNGFGRMELVSTASLMGIRETRRIIGDYILNIEDFRNQSVFEDEIGRYSYPVDIHIAKPDKESYEAFHKEFTTMRLGKGESYGIPYRILTPEGLENVLVAGRCVSTDRNMQASIRVMPGCYITGQAAGVAAAMVAADGGNAHLLAVRDLQVRLRGLGAYLPNLPA